MKKIENLFGEQEPAGVKFELKDEFFIDDVAKALPQDIDQANFMIFSRLTAYFVHGILFYRGTIGWHPALAFAYGSKISISRSDRQTSIRLPEIPIGDVWRAKSDQTLASLGFSKLFDDPKLTSVLFSLPNGFAVLLTSPLADPWLKSQLSQVCDLFQSVAAK